MAVGTKSRKRKPAAKRAPSNNGATKLLPPDVIGDSGRARIIAEMFDSLQTQKFRLQAAMVGNNERGDDIVQGIKGPKGKPITYDEQIARLDASEERLTKEYEDYMPDVEKLLVQIRAERGE